MSRLWCLAIALLVLSSMAAAAAISSTAAVDSRYVNVASHADDFFHMAAKQCTPASSQRKEDVDGTLMLCTYTTRCDSSGRYAGMTKTCKKMP